MRCFTKQFFNSNQFRGEFYTDQTYEQYVDELSRWNPEKTNQQIFEDKVKILLSEDLYYAKEVKELLLDCNGQVKPLDKNIYETVIKFSRIYNKLIDEAFEEVEKAASQIAQDALSVDLKGLADSCWWWHDDTISSIKSKKRLLVIRFDSYNIEYRFALVKGYRNKNIKKYVGCIVLYTELFRNEDYTYEFSILLWDDGELHEFSIHFRDMEIREAWM